MSRREPKHHSVYWYLPHRKKPFAYSTVATRDLIETILEKTNNLEEALNQINYDEDAKQILIAYIVFNKGRDYGKNNRKRHIRNDNNH